MATWRRRTAQGGRGHLGAAIAVAIAWSVAWIGPLALPAAAILADVPSDVLLLTLVPLALLVVTRLLLALTQRQPLLSVVWHPVTVLVVLVGQVAGIVDRVRWPASGPAAETVDAPDDGGSGEPSGRRPAVDDAADEDLDDPFGDLPDPVLFPD